jgi:hypothetical protein
VEAGRARERLMDLAAGDDQALLGVVLRSHTFLS